MKIIFIRHGRTAGNLEKRYIGRTDEPLCKEGIAELESIKYPDCDAVFASPMNRCLQTAKLIYPEKSVTVCNNFRECDFGDFEGKNYRELTGSADYQHWIDSGGTAAFPNGETPSDFKKRCIAEFEKAVAGSDEKTVLALVVHGGTIMSVMEKYVYPKGGYYDFQVPNAHGFITGFDGKKIIVTERI